MGGRKQLPGDWGGCRSRRESGGAQAGREGVREGGSPTLGLGPPLPSPLPPPTPPTFKTPPRGRGSRPASFLDGGGEKEREREKERDHVTGTSAVLAAASASRDARLRAAVKRDKQKNSEDWPERSGCTLVPTQVRDRLGRARDKSYASS